MMDESPPIIFHVEPSTSTTKPSITSAHMRQVVAHAVIERLQQWCMQLFWMTILCVINCCGDENPKRRSDFIEPKNRKQRQNISEIEQKMLRHLTSPYLTSPLRPVQRSSRKRSQLSRPPSPQLFDIVEEE